jgi:hypothetical protein
VRVSRCPSPSLARCLADTCQCLLMH